MRTSQYARKRLFTIGATLLATLIVAAPASATEWGEETNMKMLKNGQKIGGVETRTYTGPIVFENEAGGFGCTDVSLEMALKHDSAQIASASFAGCTLTGVLSAIGCEFTEPKGVASELPWPVTYLDWSNMRLDGFQVKLPMNEGCPLGTSLTIGFDNSLKMEIVEAGVPDDFNLRGMVVSSVGEMEVDGVFSGEQGAIFTMMEVN